jgi:hypothetical protein
MKNIFLITTLLIATIGMNSCKDKTPEPQPDFNDLKGYWISIDSNIQQIDGVFQYTRDTLHFTDEEFVYNKYITLKQPILFNPHVIYTVDYFKQDSLVLDLFLFRYSSALGPVFPLSPVRIEFKDDKKILIIDNLLDVHGFNRFNKFRRL